MILLFLQSSGCLFIKPLAMMPCESPTQIKSSAQNQRQAKALSPTPNGMNDNIQETPARSPTPNKQKRRNRNNRAQSKPKELPLVNNHPVSPLTPPRATNQLDMLPLDGTVSPIVPNQKNSRPKKRSNKSNLNSLSAAPSADPANPSSKVTDSSMSITPVKSAPQMYAGPTFHASPAPSSLPIPKFFSRSAPPTDTEASLKTILSEETSEESSSAGDESPTLRNSVRAEGRKVCDPSPLDMLFNADREEKARRQLASPASIMEHARAHSASPLTPSHRTHSDNVVTQSTQPMELEGSPYMVLEGPRIESSPSVLLSNETSSAQAKTAALKSLLSLPSPSLQHSQSGAWSVASTRGSSPASTPGPFTGTRRSISGSSTPLYTPSSSFASPPFDSTSFLSSPSINGKRPSQSRPMSSQLRQDVTNNLLADLNELPSSPSPSRYKLYKQPVEAHNGNIFTLPRPTTMKFQAEDALRSTARGMGSRASPSSATDENRRPEATGGHHAELEANLRQILKVPL